MKTNKKYYYIGQNGNKHEYNGAVINNHNGTFTGYLSKDVVNIKSVDLVFHEAVEHVDAKQAFFTYINDQGEEKRYYGVTKTAEDGSKYMTYSTIKQVDLKFNKPEPIISYYYTYKDVAGVAQIYKGEVTEENGTYYGVIVEHFSK